jgi:hypothetical protein
MAHEHLHRPDDSSHEPYWENNSLGSSSYAPYVNPKSDGNIEYGPNGQPILSPIPNHTGPKTLKKAKVYQVKDSLLDYIGADMLTYGGNLYAKKRS